MNFRTQVLSGIRWTAGVRLLAQLFTWALTLVIIRILSPADYGLLAMATMFLTLAAMFSELGLGAAIVQRAEVDDQTLRKVFGAVLVLHALLTGLLVLVAPFVAQIFDEPRVMPVLRVLSLQFAISAFAVIPDALLQRRMHYKGRSLVELASVITGSVTTLMLALAGKGVWALVFGSLVTYALRSSGLMLIVGRVTLPSLDWRGIWPLLRFGGRLTVTQVLWALFAQSDAFVCGRLLGKEALGLYSVAMHLASLPIQRIAGIVNQVAFPAFARVQSDLARVRTNVLAGVRLLSFFAFPALWGISSIAPELVDAVLGPRWAASATPLQILAFLMPLRMVANFIPNAVQGVGRADLLLTNAIWAIILAPPVFFLAASHWGVLGLALAWMVVMPVLFAQAMFRSAPAIGLRVSDIVSAMWPAAANGLAMCLAVTVARIAIEPIGNVLARLVLLIGTGIATYLVSAWMLNRSGVNEVRDFARAIMNREAG